MGIINEYVNMRVNAFTYNYYNNLGYDIPKRINKKGESKIDTNEYFKVKVTDLPLNSHVAVQVSCDSCGKNIDVIYENYNKVMNKHSEYLCASCANKKFNSGENNYNWNHNLSDEDRMDRRINYNYGLFIRKVLDRDNYKCQCCGSTDKDTLVVHHLDGYNWCFERRYDETNAITLCKTCHSNFHVQYGFGNNTKQQFLEWMNLIELEFQENNNIITPSRKIYCYEDDKVYDSAIQIKILNGYKSVSNIYSVCNHKPKYKTAYGKHWFWYDEYKYLSKNQISNYISN